MGMPQQGLRDFVADMERAGLLIRITDETRAGREVLERIHGRGWPAPDVNDRREAPGRT